MVRVPKFPGVLGGCRPAGRRLSSILKGLRGLRGLRPAEVAAAMGMPLRSFEHFEAGGGRLDPARVLAFAEATNTDGFAILAALVLNAHDLPRRTADNKLVTILLMALQDFDAAAGEDITQLDARDVIIVFEKAFAELQAEAIRRRTEAEAWMANHGVTSNEGSAKDDEGPIP